MTFLGCRAWRDDTGARCGLPAEVRSRYAVESTPGPLESVVISCPLGHWFNGPIEFLTLTPPERAPFADTADRKPRADHREFGAKRTAGRNP